MDDDEIRRGRPAVHIAYDLPTAINAGDAMLAVGFEVLALSNNIPSTHLREVVLTISDMVRRVAEGQQLDISFEDRKTVTESEYIEMIEGKTAVMFRTCGRIGSLLSNASEDIVEIMTEWGLNVGLCFQLMDDLIDVLSDSKTLGKPAGSDLAQGKRTLMVIHALEQSDSPAKRDVLAALGKGEEVDAEILAKGLAGLHEIGSVAYARERAEEYHSIAHACLNKLPGDGDLTALRELTDFQLMRLS
jgi:geranylgeranyl diphosphate synthase type I